MKEKVINEALSRCEERISFLKSEIFENDPVSKQIEIHHKFAKFLEETKGKERTTDKSIAYVNKLSDEMDLHKERAKTYDLEKLMHELTDLESERNELINESWLMKRQKK